MNCSPVFPRSFWHEGGPKSPRRGPEAAKSLCFSALQFITRSRPAVLCENGGHAAVPAVAQEAVRNLPKNVALLACCHDTLREAQKSPRSVQVFIPHRPTADRRQKRQHYDQGTLCHGLPPRRGYGDRPPNSRLGGSRSHIEHRW